MLNVRADRKLRWLLAVAAAVRGAVKAVVPGQKHATEKDLLKTCAHGNFTFFMVQCSPKAETCCSRRTDAVMQDIADDSMLYDEHTRETMWGSHISDSPSACLFAPMRGRWRGRGPDNNVRRPNQPNDRVQQVGARESHNSQSQPKSAIAAAIPTDESRPVVGICPTMCSFDEAIEREKHMEVGVVGAIFSSKLSSACVLQFVVQLAGVVVITSVHEDLLLLINISLRLCLRAGQCV
jgi:hypothetical protein